MSGWVNVKGRHEGRFSIVWIEPSVVVEVQYAELMQGRLRDAVSRRVHSEVLLLRRPACMRT